MEEDTGMEMTLHGVDGQLSGLKAARQADEQVLLVIK
jgi:hypothetical protein